MAMLEEPPTIVEIPAPPSPYGRMRGSVAGAAPRPADTSVSSSNFEEPPTIVGILAPPSSYGGMRAWHSGDEEAAVATFWGEEQHQRLVEDFPLEFAAWLYRPRYYVASCCVLGLANFVLMFLIIWRSPYGDTNVRAPRNRFAVLHAPPFERPCGVLRCGAP